VSTVKFSNLAEAEQILLELERMRSHKTELLSTSSREQIEVKKQVRKFLSEK